MSGLLYVGVSHLRDVQHGRETHHDCGNVLQDLEPAAPSAGVIKSAWAEDDDEPDGWSLQSDAEEKNICREFVESADAL